MVDSESGTARQTSEQTLFTQKPRKTRIPNNGTWRSVLQRFATHTERTVDKEIAGLSIKRCKSAQSADHGQLTPA